MTIQTFLDVLDTARRGSDRRGFTFVGSDGTEHTLGFATLVTKAYERGAQLRSFGLKPGDRVALAIPESEEFILSFLGAVSAGFVPVPLYPPLSMGRLDAYLEGIVRTLNTARASLLVTTAQVEPVLWSAVSRVPTLRDLVAVEKLAARPSVEAPPLAVTPSDPLFLQFTSGSTSTPRGVVVTHSNLLTNAAGILVDGLEADPAVDRGVSWLPLYHDMGLIGCVLAPVVYGLPMIFLPTLSFLKRPTLWFDTIHRHRASLTFAPNFAYARLVKRATDADLARWDLSCVRALGCGAEPIHGGTMRAFADRFAAAGLRPEALLPSYGMAEATLAITFTSLRERVRTDSVDAELCAVERRAVAATGDQAVEFVSCGRPLKGHEVGIFDSDHQRLGERRIGEIRFRGPSVAAGYDGDAEATQATFGTDGWLRTGDVGYIAEGELFISGRLKDILIVNGRNYYPQSIEWAVEQVEGIRKGNVVAFSVPGESSEEIVLVAETAEREPAAIEALEKNAARRVTEELGLAVGDIVLIGPGELPKTSSGKAQRRKTREQYLAGSLGNEGVRSLGSTGERLTLARHLVKGFLGKARHRLLMRADTKQESEV